MHVTTNRPKVTVTADGTGLVSHAGSRLLGDVAAMTGLDTGFAEVVKVGRRRRSAHDPGRVLTDLAVMLADGGEAISDLAVLREQPDLFGRVASTPTAWRVLAGIDQQALAGLRSARAQARERAWLARAELGRQIPQVRAGGKTWKGLVIDIDANLVTCHSEKESAAATFKGGFGYHPVRREALSIRVEVKDRRRRPVAQGGEAEGSLTREVPGRAGSSPDNAGTCWYCQTVRVRQA